MKQKRVDGVNVRADARGLGGVKHEVGPRGLKVQLPLGREECVKRIKGLLGAAKPQYRQYVKETAFPKVHEQACVNYKIKSKRPLTESIVTYRHAIKMASEEMTPVKT